MAAEPVTHLAPGSPRSWSEMRFFVSLYPCGSCGRRDGGDDLRYTDVRTGDGRIGSLAGACGRCGAGRIFTFPLTVDPLGVKVQFPQLGGPEPSRMIAAGAFVEELLRLAPSVSWEPERMAPAAWRASGSALWRVLTCLLELQKLLPDGIAEIPVPSGASEGERALRAAQSSCFQRAWLEGERQRYRALQVRRAADAPRIWALEKGRGR